MAWTITDDASHPAPLPDGGGESYCCYFSLDATDPTVYLNHNIRFPIAAVADISYIHGWVYFDALGFSGNGQSFKTFVLLDGSLQEAAYVSVYEHATYGPYLKFYRWSGDPSTGSWASDDIGPVDVNKWYEIEYKYNRRLDPGEWEFRLNDGIHVYLVDSGTFTSPGREPENLRIGGMDSTGTGTIQLYYDRVTWDTWDWFRTHFSGLSYSGVIDASDLATGIGEILFGSADLTGDITIAMAYTVGLGTSLSGSFTINNLPIQESYVIASANLSGSLSIANLPLGEETEVGASASLIGIISINDIILSTIVIPPAIVGSVIPEEIFNISIQFSAMSEVVNVLKVKYLYHWSDSGDDAWKGALEVTNAASVTTLGVREEIMEFPWIRNAAMASDVASFWVNFKGSRRISLEMESKWKYMSSNIGDVIDIPNIELLEAFPYKTFLMTGVGYDWESENRTMKATEFQFEGY
jgi:hypothetical protein